MNVRIWSTVAVAAIAAIGINWWLGAAAAKKEAQENLQTYADIAAACIDADDHQKMLSESPISRETYDKMLRPILELHKELPDVSHLYTATKLGDYFISVLDTSEEIQKYQPQRPDKWEGKLIDKIPEPDNGMKAALTGEKALEPNSPLRHEAGADLACYVPIRNEGGKGKVVAILAATMNKRVATKLRARADQEALRNLLIALTILGLGYSATRSSENRGLREKAARQRAEHQFKTLTEKLPGAVYIYNSSSKSGKGELLFASAGLERLTGLSCAPNSSTWKELVQLLPPALRDQEQKRIVRARNQKKPWECEFQNPSNGIWIQNKATPEPDEMGNTIWFGTLTDITDQKNEARRLGETNAILRKINESPDSKETFQAICEYAREKPSREVVLHLLGANGTIKMAAHSEIEDKVSSALSLPRRVGKSEGAAALNIIQKEPTHIALIEESNAYREADGLKEALQNEGYKSTTIYPLYSKEGKCLGALEVLDHELREEKGASIREEQAAHLTLSALERIEATRTLEDNERLYRTLFESSPFGICETDPTGEITFANETFNTISTPTIREKLSGINAKEGRKEIREKEKTFLAESRTIEKASGKSHILTFLSDISEQKKKEEYAISSMEIAEAANKAKSEFLAVMSHEIRTPLNGVIGFSQILEAMPMGEKEKGYVEKIRQSGETLLATINDILNLSKIEAGRVELEYRPLDIRKTIEMTADVILPKAQEKKLEIHSKVSSAVPPAIIGDEIRIGQILMNLAGNAVKFTEKGSVTILADYDGKNLLLEVRDTGIGISEENQKKLFQPFSQADSSTTRKYGGTGLGLVICKKLAELMKGAIALRSKEGVGSRFLVRFPAQKTEKKIEAKTTTDTQEEEYIPLNVLVAEDDEINRLVIGEMLKGCGHEVEFAKDGREVLEKAKQLKHWVDVILMDMRMPELDGIEATKRLRESGFGKTTIIALTANAMEGDKERCLRAGMDDYLSKPIIANNLKTALRNPQSKKLHEGSILIPKALAKSEDNESEHTPQELKLKKVSQKEDSKVIKASPEATKPPSSNVEKTPKSESKDDLPIIDIEVLKSSLEFFPKASALSIITKMTKTNENSLKILLDKSVPASEKKEVAHKLCGSLGSFGCLRLEAKMRKLEQSYEKGKSSPRETEGLQNLSQTTFSQLLEAIEKYAN